MEQHVLRPMIAAGGLALACSLSTAHGSYDYYVGSELTEDGSVILGGSGEEVSSHWLRIDPRRNTPRTPP